MKREVREAQKVLSLIIKPVFGPVLVTKVENRNIVLIPVIEVMIFRIRYINGNKGMG